MAHLVMAAELSWRAYASLQLYRVLHGLASFVVTPLIPWLGLCSRRIASGFNNYLGLVKPAQRPVLWIHGVSMGEAMVAAGFAAELKKKFPGHQIAFTTTHPDVFASVKKRQIADLVAYFPLDNVLAMTRIFARWKPSAVFVAETDFWPEFSWQCCSRNIPLILINGRISSKIAQFYQAFPGLGEVVFSSFSLLAVQSEIDAQRLLAIGAKTSQIQVLGNMKADLTSASIADLTSVENWLSGRQCVVLGSLHPVEFAMLKPVIASLINRRIAVIVAPRNPANSHKWLAELQGQGVAVCCRSQLNNSIAADVMILDTMGELATVYGLAAAAFVGGTLDPSVGGHNPLEVMQKHVPLLSGPYFRNFADIVDQLKTAGGITLVSSASEAESAFMSLLNDQSGARRQVSAADDILVKNSGSLQQTLQAAINAAGLPHV